MYRFKTLRLHHFLSFDEAEIDLTDRGYCFITGVNKNPKDAARSNGAGKSTIANALAYVLVGETLSGLKSNLSNIYFNDGCFVDLEFDVDGVSYRLIRSKEDKTLGTNLKIYVNGEDKSGKGIRESQAVLDELLPDLTRELIGSVILLGQGLPDRFTANSPSGRKEILEHLSKSDFMIQDLRSRIETRYEELNKDLRKTDDQTLTATTEKNIYSGQLTNLEATFSALEKQVDLNKVIENKQTELSKAQAYLSEVQTAYTKIAAQQKAAFDLYDKTSKEKQAAKQQILDERAPKISEAHDKGVQLTIQLETLLKEINKIKAMPDICPTCGQRMPEGSKPDVAPLEDSALVIEKQKNESLQQEKAEKEAQQKALTEVEESFKVTLAKIQQDIDGAGEKLTALNSQEAQTTVTRITSELTSLIKDRDSREQQLKDTQNKIADLKNQLTDLDKKIEEYATQRSSLTERVSYINKMLTAIKRDFRGILLQNSIDYINIKAKEYAAKIFNTDEIQFELAGNNIDISFCGKDYENLSGGEKQRVDLITQFAIRDMLSKHLGFSSNILFLDEITDNLDPDSCDKVINFITEQLQDVESIFIISHHSDLAIPVDNTIVVEKNEQGVSRIL